jgi:two-component system sensor histidine kinase PrrB
VRTAALAGGGTVTVGLPARATDRTVARVRKAAVLVTALAALAAAGLGWLLAGPATRPLRELRDRTTRLGGRPGPADRQALTTGSVARTAETAEVAEALAGLLHRVELARGESEHALVSARDFAAAAEHELRTPLTAMRTDLEVLTAHPELPAAERAEVLAQLVVRQQRVEDTLAALARLATGDLAEPDRSPVELTDLVAQAVATAARSAPTGTAVEAVLPDAELTVAGSAAGLRLALDNLLANAVRHAGARRIEAAVRADGDRVLVTVDDDGAGIPPDERVAVFDRFRRGRSAHGPGSGLGLALVAQQAALHGGTAALTDSPLGGTRAVLDLPR